MRVPRVRVPRMRLGSRVVRLSIRIRLRIRLFRPRLRSRSRTGSSSCASAARGKTAPPPAGAPGTTPRSSRAASGRRARCSPRSPRARGRPASSRSRSRAPPGGVPAARIRDDDDGPSGRIDDAKTRTRTLALRLGLGLRLHRSGWTSRVVTRAPSSRRWRLRSTRRRRVSPTSGRRCSSTAPQVRERAAAASAASALGASFARWSCHELVATSGGPAHSPPP